MPPRRSPARAGISAVDTDAFYLVGSVARSVRTGVERRLSEHGVYAGQHVILGCLWDQDGITPTQLARRLRLETATVTRAISRMATGGLVERRGDATDRRLVRVWLTARGRALHRVVPRAVAEVRAEMFAELSPHDQAVLASLLGRVRRVRAG
ncbi:MAG: MarR family transcriptional regulator [Pseudonocardiales bacterium]|nr:MAG: MarR family transcriptional regulator [Pseudonocardiales bacterium]